MLRVRYSGLFAADGRVARLEHCRTLITAAAKVAGDGTTQAISDEPESLVSADEESEDEDDGIVPRRAWGHSAQEGMGTQHVQALLELFES